MASGYALRGVLGGERGPWLFLFRRDARPPRWFGLRHGFCRILAADSLPSDGVFVAYTGVAVYPPPLWSFTTNDDQRTEKSNSRQFAHGNKICGICGICGLFYSGAPVFRGDDHWLAIMGYPVCWAVNAAPRLLLFGRDARPPRCFDLRHVFH